MSHRQDRDQLLHDKTPADNEFHAVASTKDLGGGDWSLHPREALCLSVFKFLGKLYLVILLALESFRFIETKTINCRFNYSLQWLSSILILYQ